MFNEDELRNLPTPAPAEPPTGLVAPISGFGLVWGANPAVRDALGWGTQPEAGPFAGAYQPFSKGVMLFSPTGLGRGKTIYVLYENGTFERYDDLNQ
jgi:serine/threonine-protein kinase